MAQAPAMPVWTDALIGDTTHLSAEEFGAYCLILFATWRNNGRPLANDDVSLARVARTGSSRWVNRLKPRLIGFFDISDGYLHQKRLESEWEKAIQRIKKQSDKGKRSASVRALKNNETASTVDGVRFQPNGNHPYPLSKKDSDSPSGESAPPVDPIKDLWDRGKALLGNAKSAGSLIGKLRQQHGAAVVLQAIVAAEAELPSDPASFLIGCCNRAKANGYAKRLSPAEKLFLGFAQAAGDFGADSPPAKPLLDS